MRNLLIIAAVLFFIVNSGLLGGKEDKPIEIPPAAPGKSQTDARPVKENVIAYHTGDQSMNSAKKKARETWARIKTVVPSRARAPIVKSCFPAD